MSVRVLGWVAFFLVVAGPAGAQSPPFPAQTSAEFPRVHLFGDGLVDVSSRRVGFELGASYALAPQLDVGAGVTIGSSVGALLLVDGHTRWSPTGRFRPFAQARALVLPSSSGYGAQAWAGASLELGPGRAKLGPGVAYFAPSEGYRSLSVLGLLSYELDLFRPTSVPLGQTAPAGPAQAAAPTPVARVAHLHGQLFDLENQPVNGLVRVLALNKQYDASPSFDAELPPGDYLLEADAPGYLIRGRKLKLEEGVPVKVDFVLRPVPRQKVVRLGTSEVELRHQIQFESGKATILSESFYILDEVVDVLLRNTDLREVQIEGHTDDLGGAEVNQILSEDRALAVASYLIDKGVDAPRLRARGFGMSKPLGPNTSEQGRARNRRVQFKIIGP